MLNWQREKKNGIDWCTATWNPISGCKHGCGYCYLHRLARYPGFSMDPKFRRDYLKDLKSSKLKAGDKVFVGSSGDMMGEWVPYDWQWDVAQAMLTRPDVRFQLLTKNPRGYRQGIWPWNCWLGTSIDTQKRMEGLKGTRFEYAMNRGARVYFLSIEPLLEPLNIDFRRDAPAVSWVIIGANSNKGAPKPPDAWADIIIERAIMAGVAVWVKDNYQYHTRIKQFPVKGVHYAVDRVANRAGGRDFECEA